MRPLEPYEEEQEVPFPWPGRIGDSLRVKLYLYSDDLDPVAVTEAAGVVPESARRKGPWIGRSGRTHNQFCGVWILDSAIQSDDLGEHVRALLGRFQNPALRITDLPGVDRALFSVLVTCPNAVGAEDDPPTGVEVELTPAHMADLARLGAAFSLSYRLDWKGD